MDSTEQQELNTLLDLYKKEKVNLGIELQTKKKMPKLHENPLFEEKNKNISNSDVKQIDKLFQDNIKVDNTEENMEGSDTFFKRALDLLFSPVNIGLKTDYDDKEEQFAGSKMEFMQLHGGFDFTNVFVKDSFETKRCSLHRKSRLEIVKTLWEREQERKALEEKESMLQQKLNM
jgi:hypothetical protein